MTKLARPFSISPDPNSEHHNFLDSLNHSHVARYVKKMRDQTHPDETLVDMEHTLAYSPVYRSFAEAIVPMIKMPGFTNLVQLSQIERFVEECGIKDIIFSSKNAQKLAEIERLEEQIEALKSELE